MRVFVTGATGFVGQAIGDQLRLEGHELTVLARNPNAPHARDTLRRWQARILVGDATQDGPWISQLEGIEAAVHTVGIISECGAATFENVHVQGMRRLLSALARNNVRRLVHISALGTRPDSVSRYHRTKWEAEEMVRRSGLEFTILRPSVIYGPRDHFVNLFAKISRFSPVLPVIGTGLGRLQPVSVETVAASVAAALRQPLSIGRTVDLCGPEAMSFQAMLGKILQTLSRKRWLLRLPLPLAWPLAAFCEWMFPLLWQRAPPLNRDQIVMLEENNAGDPKAAFELFGCADGGFLEGMGRFLKSPLP